MIKLLFALFAKECQANYVELCFAETKIKEQGSNIKGFFFFVKQEVIKVIQET